MKAEANVLVCFPLKQEAAPFRKVAANKPGTSILLTGIGRRNAEKALREFLAGGASAPASRAQGVTSGQASTGLVLTCGFAGGLNPDLKLGEVIFEFGIRNSEFGTKLIAAGAKPAKFFCADRVATTVAEKKKLRLETGADAVEMESAAIYAVCRESGIRCATVRVISDTANEDLPLDFNVLSKADKNLDYGKLFLAIAKSPGKIGPLLKLQKQTQFAAEQLGKVLAAVL